MGAYGAGKAFNLRFAQNQYNLRNGQMSGYKRLQPPEKDLPTQINICGCPNLGGPSRFERFVNGYMQGTQMGSMLGMAVGSIFSLFGARQTTVAQATPAQQAAAQSAESSEKKLSQDDQLNNLKTFFPNDKISKEDDGKFSAVTKSGKLLNNLTYEEMKEQLAAENATSEKPTTTTDENPTTDNGDGNPDVKAPEDETDPQGSATVNGADPQGSVKSGSGNSRISMDGWYRSSNDKSKNVNQTHNADGSGKNATQITRDVLNTKLGGALTPAQQEQLKQEIIIHNPSVFNSDGTPKDNADYSKLDIPTMDWIKTNILKETEETKTDTKGENSATAKAANTTTKAGNNQRVVNILANKGYRETNCKNIYYKDGQHYVFENNKLYKTKQQNIKQVNSDGSWYDTAGKLHKEPITRAGQ